MTDFDFDFYKNLYAKNTRLNNLGRRKLICPPVLADRLHEVALNLTVPEVSILATLENKLGIDNLKSTPLCMKQFAELLGFCKATISVAVGRLVKKQLVEKYYLNNNRKTTYLRLTETGKQLGKNEDNIHASFLQSQLTKHFDAEEIKAFNDAYDTLIGVIKKFDDTI